MIWFLFLLIGLLVAPDAAHAGPVFMAVLSAGGGFGAAFTATAVGGFLTQTIVGRLLTSVALSGLQAALAPKPKSPGIVTETTMTGSTRPMSFTLGTYATAGGLLCPPMSHGKDGKTPNAYRTYVIVLGAVPGMSLSRLMLNGEYVELGTTPHADYGLPILDRYTGYAWVKFYDGSQTAADPMLLAKYGSDPDRPWAADMVGTDLCYAILTFRYSAKIWTSGEPAWRFELEGIPLYDPRKDSTVGGSGSQRWSIRNTWAASANPLVQAYNIMRGITVPGLGVWGGELPADDLPLAEWFAAMNACDVVVTVSGGGSEPRYRAAYEVTVDMEPAAVIEELFRASATQIAEVGGVFKPRTGGPGLPIYFMTDDDIVITSPQELDPFPASESRYNGITANAPDPAAMWEPRPAPDRYNAEWEDEDGGHRRVASLQLPACPYPLQVQRVMRAYIKDERRFRRHAFTLPPDAAILEPLDTLAWTSDRNGYSTKRFEVSELQDDVITILQGVSCREVDPTDYDDPPNFGTPPTAVSTVRRPVPAQVLAGFDAVPGTTLDANGNPRRPHIRLLWDGEEQDGVTGIEWEVRLHATGETVSRGSTTNVEAGSLRVFDGILANTAYEARARQMAVWAVAWTAWVTVNSSDVRLAASDLSDEINTAITEAVDQANTAEALAAATQAELDALAAGFSGSLVDGFNSVNTAVEAVEATQDSMSVNLDGLGGTVQNILGLKANLLTGTAFAAMLTQLEVDSADGLSAWVTAQGTALTALQMKVAASYVLRVGAGGAAAGLEIVAQDGLPAGPASAIKLNADFIDLVGKVRASHLVVSDTSNMIPDPGFEELDNWYLLGEGASGWAIQGDLALPFAGGRALRFSGSYPTSAGSTYSSHIASKSVPVSGGKTYAFGAGIDPNSGATGTISMTIYWYDVTGTYITNQNYYADATSFSRQDVSAQVVAPANATSCRVGFRRGAVAANGSYSGTIFCGDLTMRAAVDASLIVDGTIETRHLKAAQIITEDLIVDGAVSKRFFMNWTSQNSFTSTSAAAVGVGVTAAVAFSARSGNQNPVMITYTSMLYSAGSGAAKLFLQRWNGTSWVDHDLDFALLNYTAGYGYPTVRRVEGFGLAALPNGTYRMAAAKNASGNANFSLGQMTVTFEQLNK